MAATNSAMLDWTLDPNPSTFNPCGDQPHTAQDSSHVPIILRYSVHTLATLKPPNQCDLIDEAATEFHLDPKSIYLAILINQYPVKISLSLYRRIAPLSTIHVQLNTPCPIFHTLPGHSEPISCPAPPTNTSTNTTAMTSICTAGSSSHQPQTEQVINDILNSFTAVSPAVSVPQPVPVHNSSSAPEIPLGGSSPPAIVSLLPSPTSTNGLDSLHLSKEKIPGLRPSPASATTAGIPAAATLSSAANGTTNQNNQPTTSKNSKKRFLINSLASASTSNQQPRHPHVQEQDPHQTRRSKFPFLAQRQPSNGSPSSSNALHFPTAMSIADSTPETSPRPSRNAPLSNRHPSSDMFSADLFKNFPAS